MQTKRKARAVTAAARGNSVLVFATGNIEELNQAPKAYKVLNKKEFSSYKCTDCGTHMHAVASVNPEPFCVTCGSEKVESTNQKLPETAALASDEELASVVCLSCNLHNVVQSSVVKAAHGDIHCAGCGSHLTVAGYEELPEAISSDADLEDTVDEVIELNMETHMANGDDFPEVDGLDADDSDEDMDLQTEDDQVSVSDMVPLDVTEDDQVSVNDVMSLDFDDKGFVSANEDDDEDEDEDKEDAESYSEVDRFTADELEVTSDLDPLEEMEVIEPMPDGEPLLESLDMGDDDVALSFVAKANRLVAMKGFYAVATVTKQTAGKNGDLLGTPQFEEAVRIQASKVGLKRALAQFGFEPLKVKAVDQKVIAKKTVEAKMHAVDQLQKERKVFSDCLALAAVGLSRNMWREQKNELKASVEETLQQFGVRNPKRITANLFADKGLSYSKTLVEVATKLSKMGPNARKEFADMLDLVEEEDETTVVECDNSEEMPMNDYTFEGADMTDQDEDDLMLLAEEIDNVTSRLAQTAHPVKASKQKQAITAHAILTGKAPLNFSV